MAEIVNTLLNNARHTIYNVTDNKLGTQTLDGSKPTIPTNSTFTPPDSKTDTTGNPNNVNPNPNPNPNTNPFVAPDNKQEGNKQEGK